MPSIGPRSAERIALWLTSSPDARPDDLAAALTRAAGAIRSCDRCGFFAVETLCAICADADRTGREICVVETATDILPIERTASYRGSYHALGGRLAPLDNVGPDDLRIASLTERIRTEHPTEIILAVSSDVEGEATANYIADELKTAGIPLTRIAQGLPAGGGSSTRTNLPSNARWPDAGASDVFGPANSH